MIPSTFDRESERHDTATKRDTAAEQRDVSALTRDRAAAQRDLEDDERDAEISSLTSFFGAHPAASPNQIMLRGALDRQRSADDRSRSAMHRADADADRKRAASDRLLAGEDRELAGMDRARETAERDEDEVGPVTGARRRGLGHVEVQREIDRSRRGSGRLIAAYVVVDGLQLTDDTNGHGAGDAALKHIIDVLHANLRSYEIVVRVDGDGLVCVMSDVSVEKARERFDQITAQLRLTPDDGSIAVGLAELADGDSAVDLIGRAGQLLRNR